MQWNSRVLQLHHHMIIPKIAYSPYSILMVYLLYGKMQKSVIMNYFLGEKHSNVVQPSLKGIDIFGSKKTEFLPSDILTVECCLFKIVDELCRPLSMFAQSRVEKEKVVKTFERNISEENLFQGGYTILEHVEPIINGDESMIKLLSRKNCFEFESTGSMSICKMKLQIMLLDATKMKKLQILNHEHNFSKQNDKINFVTLK